MHEVFDRVHDGAVIIDPDKTALALFVMPDGQVQIRSPHGSRWVASALRKLADKLDEQ